MMNGQMVYHLISIVIGAMQYSKERAVCKVPMLEVRYGSICTVRYNTASTLRYGTVNTARYGTLRYDMYGAIRRCETVHLVP